MSDFLRIEDVRRQVGETEILAGISLSVPKGDVVGIIGPSGSGKSSLLRCVAGLDPLSGGRVLVEGRTPRPGDGTVGMVFQQFNLWPHLTAQENVALALRLARKQPRREAAERARAMLDRVGLIRFADRRPAQLSGGQQQRVAIARTLAVEPRLILFDEPTASLDPELTTEVLDVIRGLAESGQTMMVVSHEMGFVASVARRAVFLDHGRVLVDGTAAEVFGRAEEPRLRRFLSTYLARVAWTPPAGAAPPPPAPPPPPPARVAAPRPPAMPTTMSLLTGGAPPAFIPPPPLRPGPAAGPTTLSLLTGGAAPAPEGTGFALLNDPPPPARDAPAFALLDVPAEPPASPLLDLAANPPGEGSPVTPKPGA